MSDYIPKRMDEEKLRKLLNFLDDEMLEYTYLEAGSALIIYFMYLYRTLLTEKYKYDEASAERMVDMLMSAFATNIVNSYEATVAANVKAEKLN